MELSISKVEEEFGKILSLRHETLDPLVKHLSNGKDQMMSNALPLEGAVYIFWWTGGVDQLKDNMINRSLNYKGPKGRDVEINYSKEWIDAINQDIGVPLYVGRLADNFNKRISLHLQLGAKRVLPLGEEAFLSNRKTTSNQLRDRVERMFIDEKDTRQLILDNIGLSYVILDGDEESVNRYFLVKKLIGGLFPLFNVDIER